MKYLFGPVNSRRLGLSLGIDLLPYKICNFNCIYCEVGATSQLTCERREYLPTGAILAEIDELLARLGNGRAPDIFTITATGEPTLHSGIGRIISHLKNRTAIPVAVLTNGSLLHLPEVRADLLAADLVIPSLDAARPASFRKINRPAAACGQLEQIIEGLGCFRNEFKGRLWLEILLARGINDQPADLAALKEAIARIAPALIQLNTVARPPLEPFAQPLSAGEMAAIARQLAEGSAIAVEVIAAAQKAAAAGLPEAAADTDILQMLRRRPCTAADICTALHLDDQPTALALDRLEIAGQLASMTFNGRKYYQVNAGGSRFKVAGD